MFLQVVIQWGDQLPSHFDLEISLTANTWEPTVVQQVPQSTAQAVDLTATTQWLRVKCSGACSIQELQVRKLGMG